MSDTMRLNKIEKTGESGYTHCGKGGKLPGKDPSVTSWATKLMTEKDLLTVWTMWAVPAFAQSCTPNGSPRC
jgi:hypothetical protein